MQVTVLDWSGRGALRPASSFPFRHAISEMMTNNEQPHISESFLLKEKKKKEVMVE